MNRIALVLAVAVGVIANAAAQERFELESIYVKGNKEFPQTLYVVPWKEIKGKDREEQPLVLHSLFGDLFDPIYGEGAVGAERNKAPQ